MYFIIFAFLLTAIALPRGLAIDRLVTPDEVNWLTGSGNFYQALIHLDFANTYQLEHPGVTTLWAGAAGFLWSYPAYADEGPGQIQWWQEEVGPVLRARGHEPLEVLIAGRIFMVLGITLVLMAAFLAAQRLLGFWPAFIGFLFIAVDPFHIAHSRLLHQDGLLSSLVLLSLLTFLNYLYRGGRRFDLVLSAVAAALAWLTKSPTLFLAPFIGLLILLELQAKWRRQERLARKDLQWTFYSLVIWGAVSLVVFVLLWPAMWVDPFYTLWRVLRATVSYAANGHEAPLYFNGVITEGDPGILFYPVTYLWRVTPFVIVGLGLSVVALVTPRTQLIRSEQRRPLAALLLFVALFTFFMSLGAKKFDRYLLPVYPPLDLVAGIGWLAAAHWVQRRWPQRPVQAASLAFVLLALIGQAGSAASASPYYLSYYNPMLGGTAKAPKVMMVGWGEGLDQAAHFLNSRPGGEPPKVMLGVWTGTFSYFFKGQIHWSDFTPGETAVRDWLSSDYCVIYINQWQRGRLPQDLLDYLAGLTPALVVRLQGLEYVRVYDLRGYPPPDYLLKEPITLER